MKIENQLKELSGKLDAVIENQKQTKGQVDMLFSDITGFETLVLKIMDNFFDNKLTKEKYQF